MAWAHLSEKFSVTPASDDDQQVRALKVIQSASKARVGSYKSQVNQVKKIQKNKKQKSTKKIK